MARIGYHASHEQFPPSALLRQVRQAQQVGFASAMCSDHFHPWSENQGQSGFAWSWLGAALQATSLTMGTVCAPGQRYHPAIIAQAAATLAEMYPDRFWLALGSGEALNEHITGDRWPSKPERDERLLESVEVMRSLWRGEMVNHRGHFVVEDAKLYTRPLNLPMVVGAAITPSTAQWVAGWGDAMITVAQPVDKLRQVVEAFRSGGGAGKPMFLQVQLSYGATDDEALRAAHEQWSTNIFGSAVLTDLRLPEDFTSAAEFVNPEDMTSSMIVSADLAEHVERIQELAALGFDEILLHNVHRNQESFIRDFGSGALPELSR
ncbi:TIGR03885 family FMN-dependent LLM class oxidoreductase [Natronoglycomyces albus]|uniref:TIGR03885 family FMN-dependent LLM class oxidoreductase n=1 Tax=Natronoglycomyces albus TaxID=2811108 RepID=A0A895XMW1_9ACTN|nr:TIGR03885 family FMN-dependent LLM class oxidoreductase [Natronoglycomyces albus]QSB06467.1 TIGR03885 family FMN-dependent LLM class oxidoreductase [Natronoglycomyces albus]